MHFMFKKGETLERTTLLFCNTQQIFSMNFITKETKTIYKFEKPFRTQPQYFECANLQKIFIISNEDDCLLVDIEQQVELDINDEYQISEIKSIFFDNEDRIIYIVANKHHDKFGFYV